MLFVVSVSVRLLYSIVIGGLQSGWNTGASVVSEMSALPLCTVKVPDVAKVCLFVAFGPWPPGLMHATVPVIVTLIDSPPSPASLARIVRLSSAFLVTLVALLMKCGLPADATVAMMPAAKITVISPIIQLRRISALPPMVRFFLAAASVAALRLAAFS